MKNSKTSIRLSIAPGLIAMFLLFGINAQAQLTSGLNLRSIFSGTTSPELLFKYQIADRAAVRFAISGSRNHSEGIQNFYPDNYYDNLNQWPSEIDKSGTSNTYSNFGLRPGFEYRKHLNTKTYCYSGIDVLYSQTTYNYVGNSHSAYATAPQMYTISQVRRYSYEGTSTNISPSLLFGMSREIAKGFSVFGEASVSASFSKNTTANESLVYNWNGSVFETPPPPDEFIDQDIPWSSVFNWTPRIEIYLAYTLGSSSE